MKERSEIVYLSYDEATDLVERIADRAESFNRTMSNPEKKAMANLLSDIGTHVSDLIDVSNLADNYAINAEIVTPEEAGDYDRSTLQDSLFTWEEEDGTHYCIQW